MTAEATRASYAIALPARGRDGVGVTPANLKQLAAEKAALGLRRLLLQVGFPFAARREAVHARAVRERALRCRHVLVAAGPRFLRRRLQGAAIRERDLPRQAAKAVDSVEMRGRLLVRLAAGQEGDAGH